jgi:hypothetical protein
MLSDVLTSARFYLVVLMLCALFYARPAFAAADCPSSGSTCDQGTALAMCRAALDRTVQKFDVPGNPWGKPKVAQNCVAGGTPAQGTYTCAVSQGPNGGAVRCYNAAGDDNAQVFYYKGACSSRPEQTGWKGPGSGGRGMVCKDGCAYEGSVDAASPIGVTFFPTGGTCSNDDAPEPQPADNSDGGSGGGGGSEIGGGSDGGSGESGGGGGGGGSGGGSGSIGDGDGDGDGKGDEDGKGDDGGNVPGQGGGTGDGDGKASGGEGCTTPPTCSGDPIACNTNWQIWRMRCNGTATGKVDGDLDNCEKAITVESPDPLMNAQVRLQRKIACKDGKQPDWTKVTGDGDGAGTDPKPGDFVKTVNWDPAKHLDEEGFLGGGRCPTFGSFSIPQLGYTFDSGSFPYFCQLMTFLRGIVILLLGVWPAVRILLSKDM